MSSFARFPAVLARTGDAAIARLASPVTRPDHRGLFGRRPGWRRCFVTDAGGLAAPDDDVIEIVECLTIKF